MSNAGGREQPMSDVETVTVLFTDLVGSTALLSGLGPEAGEQLRQEHFGILRSVTAGTRGREVKNLGDGLMLVFASAADALGAAVSMQQALDARNRQAEVPLAVRIGISLGEAELAEDDYFGRPVVEAARLCALAEGGEILTTELVHTLVGSRGGHRFAARGPAMLKGLPDPVVTCVVEWDPPDLAPAIPLPMRLATVTGPVFCGRAADWSALETARKAAEADAGRQVVLVSGEAGIGKTRLVAEFSSAAHHEGAVVLYGRCDEEIGVPYQPWLEALRHAVRHLPESTLAEHVARHGGELGRLVPELASRVGTLPDPRRADAEIERFLLFDAVIGLMALIARDSSLVLVLDDLHWADRPTLSLLRHVVLAAEPMRALVLMTYRDTDVSADDPLAELNARLHRESGVARVKLDGLDDLGVAELVETTVTDAVDVNGDLANALRHETKGNPFFLTELLKHLAETGALQSDEHGNVRAGADLDAAGLPESVRQVVGQRIRRLGPDAARVLACASVIGRDFDLPLLSTVADVDEEQLVDVLDHGLQASIIEEVPTTGGRYTFAHALIRHTLYDDLSEARRRLLHRRVGEALEVLYEADPGDRIAELARHWCQATQPADLEKAIRFSMLAGEAAVAALAPDDAIGWYTQALTLIGENDRRRADVLVRLGEAQRDAGVGDGEYRVTLDEATRLAAADGDVDVLVRGALASTSGFASATGTIAEMPARMLTLALDAVGDERTGRRALLAGALAVELVSEPDPTRRAELSTEAVAIAREVGDPEILANVLSLRHSAMVNPATLEERLAATEECLQLTATSDDLIVRGRALYDRVWTCMDAGLLAEARAHMEELRRFYDTTVRTTQNRHAGLLFACTIAALDGDFDAADHYAVEALTLGTEYGVDGAMAAFAGELVWLRWMQGRLAEIEGLIEQALADSAELSAFLPTLALARCAAGNPEAARAMLEVELADRFSAPRFDFLWLVCLTMWAEVAVRLEHAPAAEVLVEMLTPWRDQMVSFVAGWNGAVLRSIGTLEAVLGRFDDADDHLERAVAAHEELDTPFWLARARLDRAGTLTARGGADDLEAAADLLAAVVDAATRYGFAELGLLAGELQSQH